MKNDPIGQTAKPEQQAVKQSSSSNSNTDPKLTYRSMPDSNPGGSGNYDSDENLSSSGNSDQVINDPGFWDSIETLGESDEEDSTPTEAPNSTSTWKLTKKGVQDNNALTKTISPTEFNDWEGEGRIIKSKELKKTVFAKGYQAGVVPVENLVPCPVPTDTTTSTYKRDKCGLITDQSVEEMRDKLIDLTTSKKDGRVKLQLDMPFYDTEKATAYMDINTGDCAFYHEDGGKYWSYVKYDKNEVLNILANSDSVKYAKPSNSNSEL